MSKTVVLYRSKYGTTKKYAQWIAEELNSDIFDASKINIKKLEAYDTIIYGGGLYAGGLLGFSFIRKNINKLSNKKIIVFAVGATLKKDEVSDEIKKSHIPADMLDKVEFFLLRGGLNYKKMNPLDRFLMYLLKKSITSKKLDDNDSKGILATYGKTVDFTNKDSIKPIIDAVL